MTEVSNAFSKGFCQMTKSDKWQVCYITHSEQYGDLKEFKRHMTTDEVMVLIRGNATLYTYENDKICTTELEKETVYNIRTATWHHLKVSEDALLVVVEDSDITSEFTERMIVDAHC